MPNYTQNLNLEKPLSNENYNIDIFNSNVDKIDLAIKEISNQVNNFEAPVKSVNGKTGTVTLAAADIKTTDGKTLEQFKADASSQLDTIEQQKGDLTSLSTINKTNLVSAINEVFQSGNNVKSDVVTALLSKYSGAGVTTSSTWTAIVNALKGIETKKYATGKATNAYGMSYFEYYGDSGSSHSGNATITGLSFVPSVVITWGYYSSYYYVSVYADSLPYQVAVQSKGTSDSNYNTVGLFAKLDGTIGTTCRLVTYQTSSTSNYIAIA